MTSLFMGGVYAQESSILLMYHRVGDSRYPTTTISTIQFQSQLAYLKQENYQVWPIDKIIDYIDKGKALPEKSVGISFDDAYQSIYDNAWPLLKKYNYPFSLMVATYPVDHGFRDIMTWDQIKAMYNAGVLIGNHSNKHVHMTSLTEKAMKEDIEAAEQSFIIHLNFKPTLFAYPYGEYNDKLREIVRQAGFKAAFGQQSSVAWRYSDKWSYPRFALNEHYGDMARFKRVTGLLPLPLEDTKPSAVYVQNPPQLHLKKLRQDFPWERMHCYDAAGRTLPINHAEKEITVVPEQAFSKGRARVNCTLLNNQGQWYWFGKEFLVE